MNITPLGLDLAKSVFQAHGIDSCGKTVLVKKLHRKQMLPFFSKLAPCLIGVEACATAHHWARTLIAMGHDVRIMPPSYVKGYVKRGKSDAIDAEAICETVQRPTMRFVPVKTVEQQSVLIVHRTRSLIVRQRTMAANALRAHLAEFGLVANPGIANLVKLAARAFADEALPAYAHRALEILIRRINELNEEIGELDKELRIWHAENEASRRLAAIPGVGVITATAIAATVTDPDQCQSGRQFASWLGLTPQQQSTGGKTRLGGISKQGDRYLRRLLVVGATAVMRHAKRNPTPMTDWVMCCWRRSRSGSPRSPSRTSSPASPGQYSLAERLIDPTGSLPNRVQPRPNWQWQSMMRNDRANGEANPSDSMRHSSAPA